MKAVQLGLFTGEPVPASWRVDDRGRWFCIRCLRVLPKGPKPRRICSCGWKKTAGP